MGKQYKLVYLLPPDGGKIMSRPWERERLKKSKNRGVGIERRIEIMEKK